MKKLILASLAASVLLFFWGWIWWGPIASGLGMIQTVPDEASLGESLASHLPADGVYVLPYAMAGDESAALHESGPIATVYFRAAGAPVMAPGVFAKGFAHMWVSVLLMAALLRWLSPRLVSFGERFCLVVGAGLATAVFDHLGRPVWFYESWSYHSFLTAYSITSWVLVGLVLAWFLHGDT
ncbi:MAG: hypothetical protein AAGN66_17065 [Acidobacteriota bacterium]